MKRTLFFICFFAVVGINAEGETWECGSNVIATLEGYTLTISGKGDMGRYSDEEDIPWYDKRENIKTVVIQHGVTSIGEEAFKKCISLASVTIPNSVTHIGEDAFKGCSSLASVIIPNSVTNIGSFAFHSCSSLASVTISNSVTSIEGWAFAECISLTSVTLPNSVTSIGNKAFQGCIGLVSVTTLSATPQSKNITRVFDGVDLRNVELYVPENAEAAYRKASGWKSFKVPESFNDFAKNYVRNKVNEWQKKGEFEKLADWQSRVNETSRQAKAVALLKEAEQEFVLQRLKKTPSDKITLGEYDSENEVYLLTSLQYGKWLLPVPIGEAPAFKSGWDGMNMKPTYFIKDNRIVVAKMDFSVPDGKTYTYSNKASLSYSVAQIDYNFDPIDINVPSGSAAAPKGQQTISTVNVNIGKSDVDMNVPESKAGNDKTFAVIIANESYQNESQVEFAKNDGNIFKDYCLKTLGIPAKNIHSVADATLNNIRREISWIAQVAQSYNGEATVIFYYAGHGIPDEQSQTAYLLPIDGYGSDIATGYSLDDLYRTLGSLPAKAVTVFMDACFSGAKRDGSMLVAARGIAIKVKSGAPSGKMVVFSAASGDETAYPYREKGHGLFTYFLLKKLQESKGNATFGELSEYITTNVRQQSIVVNSKSQTPTVTPSPTLGAGWRNMKLR